MVRPLSAILNQCYLLAEQPLIGLAGVAFLHLLALAMPTEVPVFGGVITGGTEDAAKAGIEANKVPTANAPIIVSLRIAIVSPAKTRSAGIMSKAVGQYTQQHGRVSALLRHRMARNRLTSDFANYFKRTRRSDKRAGNL
jgi:hypothetical protein